MAFDGDSPWMTDFFSPRGPLCGPKGTVSLGAEMIESFAGTAD